MKDRLLALVKTGELLNDKKGSSLNVRKYLFNRLVIISVALSIPSAILIFTLESTPFKYMGLGVALGFIASGYLYYKGQGKLSDIVTFLVLYPISTLVCTLVQPMPAFGLVQLTFFSVFSLAKTPLLGIWGRIIIPLICFAISISSFYWVDPWIKLEHEILFNAYFLISSLIFHVVFILLYLRSMKMKQAELTAQQEDFEASLKHIKVIPWKYSYEEKTFKPSALYKTIFNPEEKEGYSIESALLSHVPPHYQALVQKTLHDPHRYKDFDFVYEVEKAGEKGYFHLRGETYFDEKGIPLVLYGSIEDVSTRKKEEERISYGQSLLATTLESTINGLLVIDNRGNIKKYNRKYLEMWQMEESDVTGKRLMELVDFIPLKIKNPDNFHADIQRVIEDNKVETFTEIKLVNGNIFEVYSKPHLHKGKVVGRLLSFRDISDKKKANELLKNSEEKYRTLFESSVDGILVLDLYARKAIDCNQQMVQLFEASKEEILAGNTLTFSPEFQPNGTSSAEKRENVFRIHSDTAEIRRFEWQYRTKRGKLFDAEVMVSPFSFKGKPMAIHIIRDISQRKALMQALEEKNFQLEEKVQERTLHLEKSNAELKRSNDDLEQFAYAASHDLKEPLRMVGNFVGLLARDYPDKLDAKAHRYIQFATEGVKRMTEQMKGLLEFSLMGRSEMNIRKANLKEILTKNILNLSIYTEERHAEILLPEDNFSFICEPVMIGLLFHNLISNGIKFNKSEYPKVWIDCHRLESAIKICVKDNGIGISEDNQKKIFEIFKRLHRSNEFEGTGIGLAMCRKIVHRHGGEIWVESRPGEGSTFCFTLPFQKALKQKKKLSIQMEN